jgi:hypothetical protein
MIVEICQLSGFLWEFGTAFCDSLMLEAVGFCIVTVS